MSSSSHDRPCANDELGTKEVAEQTRTFSEESLSNNSDQDRSEFEDLELNENYDVRAALEDAGKASAVGFRFVILDELDDVLDGDEAWMEFLCDGPVVVIPNVNRGRWEKSSARKLLKRWRELPYV